MSPYNKNVDNEKLSELEKNVLRIEKEWWLIAKTREQAIRKILNISPIKYYLILSELLDEPRFWQADPVLVDRLRGLRDKRLNEFSEE